MATNVESTELDFQSIRNKLKTYFADSTEFSDYNFEASGLSNLLDVLAYNTHYNALMANMAINESFLETAQLRSSVLTHAYSLGYYPRSKTASSATLNLSVNLSSISSINRPASLTLASGTKFNSTIDGITYGFQTRKSYSATDDGAGVYQFKDASGSTAVKIYEGTDTTRTFRVPTALDNRIYVIGDSNLDTETAVVQVYENDTTELYESYEDIRNAVRLDSTSKYYILKESPNGNYELQFGDEVTGVTPTTGSLVKINYLSTNGADANLCYAFVPQSTITVNGNPYSLSVTVVSSAVGGDNKQSIESIRYHAPLTFATQNRMVTAEDYHTLIQSNYPEALDVTAWGGQDHSEVDYGKIYISIRWPEGTSEDTKTDVQNDITSNLIEPLGTVGIDPVYIEPIETKIGINVYFDFNPTLSGITSQATEDLVKTTITDYFETNLGQFRAEFRKSNLLTVIDELSDGILSSRMNITFNQSITPILGESNSYTVAFPGEISAPSSSERIITSDRFTYSGTACLIVNKLDSDQLQIVDTSGNVIVNNVGSYSRGSGTVSIVNFAPDTILSGSTIRIKAVPANPSTIKPLRNYILTLDTVDLGAQSTVDYQTTRASL